MINEKNAYRYTLWVILIFFIARLIIAAYTGLGTGESYYFRGSLQPALSYFDQPPLFFWLSSLSTRLLGVSTLSLRLPAILLFVGTNWFLFKIAQRLFNSTAGFYAVLLINLSAVFTISIGNWFQPDAPLMFFWILTVWCFIQLFFPTEPGFFKNEGHKRQAYLWWILAGIAMGLTTLSKYHIVFLIMGIFIFMLTTPENRHWMKHPGPYLALLINFAAAFPILLWNHQNNWVSFIFQGSRVNTEENFQLHFDWFFRSIGGQALWLLPWIWFPLIIQLISSFKLRANAAYWYCFCTAVFPIIFFTVITLWSNLQFHFHWQAPGYMMLFVPLGEAVRRSLLKENRLKVLTKSWITASLILTIVSMTVLAIHMKTGFWTWYGPKWFANSFGEKLDPTIDGNDYDDLKIRFENEGWISNSNIFIGTPRWWLNGKVDWALRGKKEVLCFNNDARNYAYFSDPNLLLGKDAIIVGRGHDDNILRDVCPFFDEVIRLEDVEIKRGGVTEMKLEIYYGKYFHIASTPKEEMPLYRLLVNKPPYGEELPKLALEDFKLRLVDNK
jgi:hypothetical protein